MKIAIITIGVGAYKSFLIPLIQSINKFMLLDHEKYILIFSDDIIQDYTVFKIDSLPVPLTTLLKFKYINQLSLEMYDVIYFIDGDCLVTSTIGNEILPNTSGLVAVKHPWQYFNNLMYESCPYSMAYVNTNNGTYYQGCFFGGYRNEFCKMSHILDENIKIDLKNRIISRWYDESHLNKYFIDHHPKELSSGYAYPDPNRWKTKFDFEQKIIHYNHHVTL